MRSILLCLIFSVCFYKNCRSQPGAYTQVVKGIVADADSRQPLAGITVSIVERGIRTVSDSAGNFTFKSIPVGLYTLQFSGVKYDIKSYPAITVISGKQVFLEAMLNEKIPVLNEIIISTNKKQNNALNEFAAASVRSFSMEDAKKYPVTGFDPGRIVQNFAGVVMAEDNSNAIIVRGNSPKGILWKLEGVEIPNPNHFGKMGAGGGNISMLSSNTLDKSDFYVGAFPAEFGNALSGVFDLKLRKGNKDKGEHSLMVGALGIEAASEGPFKKKSSSSYLVNFRYATFALLKGLAEINGATPDYQDISFKISLPAKKAGNFSIFGVGGINKSIRDPQKIDFAFGSALIPLFSEHEKSNVEVIGLSHQVFLSRHSYLQTILAVTADNYSNNVDSLDPHNNYSRGAVGRTRFLNTNYKLAVAYNNKINNHNTIRAGIIISRLGYKFNDEEYDPGAHNYDTIFNSRGSSTFYEGYLQWKWKPNKHFDIVPGMHYSMLALHKTESIEPRISINYTAGKNQQFIIAAGLHSRPEHLSTYFFKTLKTNQAAVSRDFKFAKAAHFVTGYHTKFHDVVFMAEAYYLYLFHIGVEKNKSSFFSLINALDVYDLYDLDSALLSTGTGKNYGLDITAEKPFVKNWHLLFTASLLKCSYTAYDSKTYPTKFDRGYQFTGITGKGWSINKNKKITLNNKVVIAGGLRESPIDKAESVLQRKTVYVKDRYYSIQTRPYFRMDMGVSYTINRQRSTHTIMLDVQNIFNYKNVYRSIYKAETNSFAKEYGLGIFPLFNYRVEF